MEAFSLLKFWRTAPGDDVPGGGVGGSDTADLTMTSSETSEEESFFDLEFTVAGFNEEDQNGAGVDDHDSDSDGDLFYDLATKDGETGSNSVESPADNVVGVFLRGRAEPWEANSKQRPQSPVSILRSPPPKFRVFMLLKKPKLEKTESADVSTADHRQSKRFDLRCKVDEVPILSLLARESSSWRSNSQKQQNSGKDSSKRIFPKDVVQKYLKLIKPLYGRVSKRSGDKMIMSSDELSTSTPLSCPAIQPVRSLLKQAEDKPVSRQGPLREVCKHLGKSRSASSAVGIIPAVRRRDDSLVQHDDGIQSAILHCKRSFTSSCSCSCSSSREFSVLSRSASDSSHEIPVKC